MVIESAVFFATFNVDRGDVVDPRDISDGVDVVEASITKRTCII